MSPNAEVTKTGRERAASDESMSVRFEDGVLYTSTRKSIDLENNLFNALNLETLREVTEFKKALMLETIKEEETAETAPDNLYEFKLAPTAEVPNLVKKKEIIDMDTSDIKGKNYMFLLVDSKDSGGASLHEKKIHSS